MKQGTYTSIDGGYSLVGTDGEFRCSITRVWFEKRGKYRWAVRAAGCASYSATFAYESGARRYAMRMFGEPVPFKYEYEVVIRSNHELPSALAYHLERSDEIEVTQVARIIDNGRVDTDTLWQA